MAEAAPLIATPGAPVPADGGAEWFIGAGGARLRAALFPAGGFVKGSIVVSPGRNEPIEKYFEVAHRLTAAGLVVLVHDWRGQGLSHRLLPDRRAGHAAGYRDFITDYGALLAAFEPRLPKPWLALGHSMGGCLTLLALATGETRFAGAILSAPMLGLQTGAIPRPLAKTVSAALTALGRGTAPLARPPAPAGFETNILTHDPARYARNLAQEAACPDLSLGGPTWGWLDFAFRAIAVLERGPGLAKLAIPLTVVVAGEERLVDNEGARRIAARVPGARFEIIPGAYHELLQETDALQAPFWRAFHDLAARAGVSL